MIENVKLAPDEAIAAELARNPSDELCGELFRRYRKKIYLWCFGYTHDAEEAVDLTQEIFVKIFRNVGSFSGLARFSTWAYQVTRNHCIGELANRSAQWRQRLRSLEEGADADPAGAEIYGAVDAMGDAERIIEAAKGYMESDELEAFVLHYREGLTVKEITRVLGCENVTGARTLIQNARRKFGRLVDEKGFNDVS